MGVRERMAAVAAAKIERDPTTLLPIVQGMPMLSDKNIVNIAPDKLQSFFGHTFSVLEESASFLSLEQSIQSNGIQSPLLVRPHASEIGRFELIAGHRRHKISIRLGLTEVPCMIFPCDDDTAIQLMAETNVQRPDWLPSEKAKTYHAHLLATQRKTGITERMRTDLTAATKLPQSRNRDVTARIWAISGQSLDMYIKLNDLLPNLMQYTDEGRIVIKGAYQLAFLPAQQQEIIATVLKRYDQKKLSASKCKELRSAGETGELDEAYLLQLLGINGGKTRREKELSISVKFTSTALLCNSSVKKALNDPLVLENIENILIEYAIKHDLPLK